MALLGLLMVSGAVAETSIFLILVPLAQAVSVGNHTISRHIGPFVSSESTSSLAVIAAGVLIFLTIVRLVLNVIQANIATSIEAEERGKLFSAYLSATWERQASEPAGRIQSIASYATAKADRLFIQVALIRSALNVVTMIAAALIVAPLGALAIIFFGLILYAGFRPVVSASRRTQARYLEEAVLHDQDVAEMATLSADIRVFGASAAFKSRLAGSHRRALVLKRRSSLLSSSIMPIYQLIGLGIAVSILGYASSRSLDVPALGIVVILLIRSLSYGQGLQGNFQKMAEYDAATSVLAEWHREYLAACQPSGDNHLPAIDEVELVDVSYSYGGNETALSNITLHLRAGEHIGIVGPSGSGKSTLAQVMLFLRKPSSGKIHINGCPVEDHSDVSLRQQVSLVPQQTLVFRSSVRENIAFFRPDISASDVELAARRAGLHDQIMTLPEGYDTKIGRSNRDLSGGQTQRLGIARALAGSPALLVLDEPTSALDVDSEELVTTALRSLPEHVIVVIIAHRMSTLRNCSRVLVLDQGRAVAIGSPSDVALTNEFFRRALESGDLTR